MRTVRWIAVRANSHDEPLDIDKEREALASLGCPNPNDIEFEDVSCPQGKFIWIARAPRQIAEWFGTHIYVGFDKKVYQLD